MKVVAVVAFRPHARGVDHMGNISKTYFHISDPTRVGWTSTILWESSKPSFQTPRAWGGHMVMVYSNERKVFRPHARGVDPVGMPDHQLRRFSDPTRVGWTSQSD